MFFEMRFDLGTLDSGERSLPFGLLVLLMISFKVMLLCVLPEGQCLTLRHQKCRPAKSQAFRLRHTRICFFSYEEFIKISRK